MSQHDYVIANGTGAAVRSDLNNALAAIVSNNSGATEPATMYAYQWWADTSTGLLKLRNAANNAWITLRELDGTLTIEAGTVSAPGLAFASDLNTGVWSPGADQFAIATNGVERVEWGTSEVVFNDGGANYDFRVEGDTNANLLFVDASADAVGIGVSAPATTLDSVGASGRHARIGGFQFAGTSATADAGNNLFSSGAYWNGTNFTATQTSSATIQFGNGALNFYTESGLTAGNTYTGNVRMSLDSSGRLGIGTTSPTFAAGGGVQASFATFSSFRATSGSNTGTDFAAASDGKGYIYVRDNADLLIGTNNTERARVDSSGRLLVGTSTSQCQLTVWDTSTSVATARFFKNAPSTQSYPALVLDKSDNTSTTAQIFLQFTINNQSTASGQINANGASQAAFGTYSDARLKENIVDLPSQWDAIKTLRPVEFDYIQSEGGGHQIGFVAQEVQEVYPDVVGERSDGMLTLTGMGKNESRLIKALQEAMERIEQLETANADLLARVAALESA